MYLAIQELQPDMKGIEMPSLDAILAQQAPPYAYDHLFEEVFHEPILVLHSSGSTGKPKAVVMTHGTFAIYDP